MELRRPVDIHDRPWPHRLRLAVGKSDSSAHIRDAGNDPDTATEPDSSIHTQRRVLTGWHGTLERRRLNQQSVSRHLRSGQQLHAEFAILLGRMVQGRNHARG